MKRRLTIARSLVNEPEVLLLDEPTTGLDPQARHVVWDRLFRLKQRGVTLVLTTHYMDEAEQLCDRLVVMDRGKIAEEGSPLELIRRLSTREVVELRFPDDAPEVDAAAFDELRSRASSGCRTASCSTPTTATRVVPARARALPPAERARAPLDARRRLPPAHRAARSSTDGVRASRVRVLARTSYRRVWRGTFMSSLLNPVLYLTALGVGLGKLVNQGSTPLGVPYLDFVAPGMLAATAMQIAAIEARSRCAPRSAGRGSTTRMLVDAAARRAI